MPSNIFNIGQPIYSKTRLTNPEDTTEVNGNNINLIRLPTQITRNDIFGNNEAVDSTERILAPNIPVGTVNVTFPTTALAMFIASTSSDDSIAGIGAQVVRIFGLDSNFNSATEDFNMNGQTGVTGSVLFQRIQETAVVQSGSSKVNLGNIFTTDDADTFTGGEPQTRCYDSMAIGDGFSKTSTFTVPNGQILMHQSFELTTTATGNNRVICKLNTSGDPLSIGGDAVSDKYYIDSNITVQLDNTRRRKPRQDIWLTVEATGQTVSVHAKLTAVLSDSAIGESNLLGT